VLAVRVGGAGTASVARARGVAVLTGEAPAGAPGRAVAAVVAGAAAAAVVVGLAVAPGVRRRRP